MSKEEKKLHTRLVALKAKLAERDRAVAELEAYMPPNLRGVRRGSEGLDRVQSDLQRAQGYLENGQTIPARSFLDRAEDRLLRRDLGSAPGSIGRTVRDAEKGRQHSDAQSAKGRKGAHKKMSMGAATEEAVLKVVEDLRRKGIPQRNWAREVSRREKMTQRHANSIMNKLGLKATERK